MKSSRGEIKIFELLTKLNLPFAEEYIFPDLKASSGRPLRFDFAIFNDEDCDRHLPENIECLIEFNGIQHYVAKSKFGGEPALRRQQNNDKKKKQYCKINNYRLVVIPYFAEDEITSDYLLSLIYGF